MVRSMAHALCTIILVFSTLHDTGEITTILYQLHYVWLLNLPCVYVGVVAVKKMGNTVPRVGLEPTSLASGPVCYHYTMEASLMSPLSPCLPVYAAPYLRGQCRLPHIYIYTYVWLHYINTLYYKFYKQVQ